MAMPRSLGWMSLTTLPSISIVPRGDVLEPGDHAQQRRFPAAGRADEDDEFAIVDVDVDALDDIDRAEALADIRQA